MKIDRTKLQNVKDQADGAITARCPACAAQDADKKGEHLIVYADGRFGCVANPKDKDHNKAILLLVGDNSASSGGRSIPKLQIRPQNITPSKRILVLGQIGQENPTPAPEENQKPSPAGTPDVVTVPSEVTTIRPPCPERFPAQRVKTPEPPKIAQETQSLDHFPQEVRDFLLRPVN